MLRMPSPRLGAATVATALAAAALTTLAASPAAADVTRCIGAVQTPGAFACYTSPRFNQSGFDRATIVDIPVVCYGLGCTGSELFGYVPGDTPNGRFTAVSYLGHSYTVYAPASSQPYVLTSDNPRLDPVVQAQVLALSAALDASNGL